MSAAKSPNENNSCCELLSDSQQKLLSRFFDGECGIYHYWRARKLVERSQAARNFVKDLKVVEGLVRKCQPKFPEVNLWARISARIEAEESSEVFLGGRAKKAKLGLSTLRSWVYDARAGLTWASGGAALASLCAFFLIQSGMIGQAGRGSLQSAQMKIQQPGNVLLSSMAPVKFVDPRAEGLNSAGLNSARLNFERQAEIAGTDFDTGRGLEPSISNAERNAFEIDWVRSEGVYISFKIQIKATRLFGLNRLNTEKL